MRRSVPREERKKPETELYSDIGDIVEGDIHGVQLAPNNGPKKFQRKRGQYKTAIQRRISKIDAEHAEDFVNTIEERARGLVAIHKKFASVRPGHLKMTEEVALELLNRMAKGEALKSICKDLHMPSYPTVMKWLRTDPDFQEAYAAAQEFRMHVFADEILEIADNSVGDVRLAYDKNGNLIPEVNYENIQRSKLRIQTRQYLMERFAKETYNLKRIEAANTPAANGNATVNVQINLPSNGRPITAGVIEQ